MHRAIVFASLILAVCCLAGCRNRCGGGCLNPWGPATIPSPPTYSLQFPGGVNATASAPSTNITGTSPNNSNSGQLGWNVQTSPTSSMPITIGTSNYQVAGSTVYGTGGGTSRIVNHDFSSTPFNDRLDPTRLGVTDASQVRPPVSYPQGFQQLDPRYAQSPTAIGFGNGARGPGFNGQPLVQGQFASGNNNVGAAGNAAFNNDALGQTNPANDPNRQAGWQNRNGLNR